jgi:hypothetical protein
MIRFKKVDVQPADLKSLDDPALTKLPKLRGVSGDGNKSENNSDEGNARSHPNCRATLMRLAPTARLILKPHHADCRSLLGEVMERRGVR